MASNIPAYGVARYGVARYGSAILDNEIEEDDNFQAQQIVLIIKDLFCSLSIDKLKSSIDRLFDYTASLEIEERSLNIILE